MGIALALEILSHQHLQMSVYSAWMLSLLRHSPFLSPQGYTLDSLVIFLPGAWDSFYLTLVFKP